MKKILFLILFPVLVNAQSGGSIVLPDAGLSPSGVLWNAVTESSIPDGWYASTVKYYNTSTGTKATYTLNVKVEYNKVVMIDFGNGGSVHNGYNNEGYIYSGGLLSFEYNSRGNIVGAETDVSISDSDGYRKFNIFIE